MRTCLWLAYKIKGSFLGWALVKRDAFRPLCDKVKHSCFFVQVVWQGSWGLIRYTFHGGVGIPNPSLSLTSQSLLSFKTEELVLLLFGFQSRCFLKETKYKLNGQFWKYSIYIFLSKCICSVTHFISHLIWWRDLNSKLIRKLTSAFVTSGQRQRHHCTCLHYTNHLRGRAFQF